MSRHRPHVLAFPYPVQGHITSMMHFSRKLAARGILVTFATTDFRLAHIRKAAGTELLPEEFEGNIRLTGLDDGLPAEDPRNPLDPAFMRSVNNLGGALEQLLLSLSCHSSLPPLTCMVSDSFLPWTLDVALKWGLPRALSWTMSFASCCGYVSTSKLIASGYDPFAQRVKRRGERPPVMLLPGLPAMDPYDLPFNCEADIPTVGETENSQWLRSVVEYQFQRMDQVAWLIGNSFEALEAPFINALCSSSVIPPSKLLLLGPLCDDTIPGFRASLWREEELDCLQWLDAQKDASILYISFGSVVMRTTNAVRDVAMALLACRQPFLWALRTGWEEAREFLSEEFMDFAMEAGKLTTWTPQLKVLSHRAVGGFFSHAGWNSVIESVCKGVPMLVWPSFLDQFTNSWAVSSQLGMGVQVMREEGTDGTREIEGAIRTLMQSEKRILFRQRAAELRAASMGASTRYLDMFVEDMFKRAAEASSEISESNP